LRWSTLDRDPAAAARGAAAGNLTDATEDLPSKCVTTAMVEPIRRAAPGCAGSPTAWQRWTDCWNGEAAIPIDERAADVQANTVFDAPARAPS
jgi:hypothetical protein